MSLKLFSCWNKERLEMNFDEEKFSKAIKNIRDIFQNMDEADGYALADVLDNLAGIIDPEILKDDFSAAEIAREYNFEILEGKIDNIKLDDIRRNLIACTCASLAFPIAKPEMHPFIQPPPKPRINPPKKNPPRKP
jgi:hypothetical protein